VSSEYGGESQAYVEVLYELDQRGKGLSAAEKELAELLTLSTFSARRALCPQ
jgi:hypothetical protein